MSDSHDRERPPEGTAPARFDNPRSIRALAHPARLAIIEATAALGRLVWAVPLQRLGAARWPRR